MTASLAPTLLSERLESVLGLLLPCAVLADVGTDHGLLPVAAVSRGLAQQAFAVDLREAPLAGARALIERTGLATRVIALQADGLVGLPPHAVDALVIAGMSGDSMLRIFEAAPEVLAGVKQCVVQPNQNADKLRAWALQNGWHLRDEQMIEERGQFFVVCAFTRGSGLDPAYGVPGWTQAALCEVGPWLLARKDAVAARWFELQRARVARWVKHDMQRLQPELDLWQAACETAGSKADRSAAD